MTPAIRPWWGTRTALVLLALAFAIPLLWPAIPPLTDLPAHMARYHIALDAGRTPSLARAFSYHWAPIGNLGVDLAVIPLAALVGVEAATRIVVMAIPVLTALGMLAVAKAAHGRVPPTAPFALPLALAWPFQFGFVNFCLAMALALLALALWIRLGRTGRLGLRALIFIPISVAIWIAHALGWGLFGLAAFGAELARRRANGEAWLRAILASGVQCLPLALPALRVLGGGAGGGENGGWLDPATKLAATASMLRDHWLPLDVASVLVLAILLYLAARDRRLGFTPVLAIPALLLLVAFLALPRMLFGGAFADVRVIPHATALAILAIRPPENARLARGLAFAGLGFVAIRVIAATASLALHAADWTRELAALPAIPHGASVYAVVARSCEGEWDRPRRDHLPSFAILRRDAFANDQWVIPGQQLLHIHQPRTAPFDHDPSQIATDRACGVSSLDLDTAIARIDRRGFDHVWTIGFPAGRVRARDLALVWRSGGSALYRIVPATAR